MAVGAMGYCETCKHDVMNGHCSGYHCVLCAKEIDMDNCDGEVIDGRTVGYLGSSSATQCESCCEWFCNTCGDPKQELCKPCLEVPA